MGLRRNDDRNSTAVAVCYSMVLATMWWMATQVAWLWQQLFAEKFVRFEGNKVAAQVASVCGGKGVPKHVSAVFRDAVAKNIVGDAVKFALYCLGTERIQVISLYEKRGLLKALATCIMEELRLLASEKLGMRIAKTSCESGYWTLTLTRESDTNFERNGGSLRNRRLSFEEQQLILDDNLEESDSGIGSGHMTETSEDEERGAELTVKLRFLSEEDGRRRLAEYAKSLGGTKDIHNVTNRDLDEYFGLDNLGEPELMYVFGRPSAPLTLDSYPPWEIRLTEISQAKHSSSPIYHDFIEGLYMYSKCERRVGK